MIKSCGKPPTCFGLYRTASRRHSIKKNIIMSNYNINVQKYNKNIYFRNCLILLIFYNLNMNF